jgi:hypothetical protein
MTSTAAAKPTRADTVAIWGLVVLMLASIWLDRQWPGSLAHVLVRYAQMVWFLLWFGSKIRRGYQRRKPHWTRDSWIRFFRLAAMPFGALVVFLALVYAFDARPELFGSRGSSVRLMSAFFDIALMLVGVVGVIRALDWLERGEPSEQFTRTRWFQRKSDHFPHEVA